MSAIPEPGASAQDWALAYLACGLSVVPVADRSKRPAIAWRPFEEKAAARDVVVDWFQGPRAASGVGVITGKVSGNLFVVDVDVGPGKEGDDTLRAIQMRHEDLPITAEVRTGGGGRHLYFRAPPGVLVKTGTDILGPGVDIRGEGGFVVAPPSVHPSGLQYLWDPFDNLAQPGIADAPDWLLDLVRADTPRPLAAPPRPSPIAPTSTASGTLGVLPPKIEDGRETYMRDTVHAVMMQVVGETGAWPTADDIFEIAAPQIERRVNLSREGRISPKTWRDELMAKCLAIVTKAENGALGTLEDAVAAYEARQRADRAHAPENGQEAASSAPPMIAATPFVLPDPGSIPRRAWIYGRHLIRKFVSVTVAPGGVGKSTLLIGDALAIATGKPLLGANVWDGPACVWMWNLEDPRDELTRRIAAAALHHGIGPADLGDRLFLDSGRDQPLRIAEQERHGGARIIRPVVDALVEELKRRRVDVLMVDPFVSSHGVEENDNGAIDLVAKEWGRVADAANCAIDLVHHARKTGGTEVTAEHGRGAVALIAAARSVRVCNRMSKEEAEKAGVENERSYFSVLADKVNLAPAADRDWFRLADVELPNGDHVGAVEAWAWPDPFAGLSLDDLRRVQSAIDGRDLAAHPASVDYVGIEIARVLRISMQEAAGRARVKQLIGTWLASGSLVKEQGTNPATRQKRPVIRVGVWAGEAP